MWFSLIVIGTCLLETSGLSVYRMKNNEKCQAQITHSLGYYVLNEEPAIIKCPVFQYVQLDLSVGLFHLDWTTNGSENVNIGNRSRIQTNEEALWFLPASLEDSGLYTCVLRNASYCIEISMSLNVMSDTVTSLPDIEYPQFTFEHSDFHIYCPDLKDFTKDPSNVQLKWYKDGELLLNSSKFKHLDGSTHAIINDVRHTDEGYYKCQLAFTHENTDFSVSRIIHLRTVDQEKRQHPIIVNPSRKTIAAAIGSKLVIPCKVFTGHGETNLIVWWVANDSFVDELFEDGRVTEGMLQTTTETDGQYFEVSLTFERIEEEDFTTDFKCIASNDYGQEVLPTHIKPAASSFAWYIAAVPALVLFLIIVIIVTNKHRKCGNKKDYSLAKL
ncbi:interleukin-1 receptor type 2-like [Pseudophryne corroboree]|uniref:interleukin-1 receptor type 2-like n=1 Tax=Pseudophryne corroboree TaxID=495146 RepID=UPI0030812344